MYLRPLMYSVVAIDFTHVFTRLQMSMSVRMSMATGVTPTPCVPTLKDPTSAAAFEDMREMV